MDELLMCSVCIERYHESERHPVLLPRCGHSFCRPCITMLINGGSIVCPTCRTNQRIDYVEKLPTEYTLLAIIHAQEHTKKETCERHAVKLSFWCRTCEIATCGECLFEDHPTHNHDVIKAARYISDMKQNAQEVAAKFMDALDDREQNLYKVIYGNTKKISNALRNITILRKDMEEARVLMKGIREENSISSATSLSEAAKFLGLKWNIQDENLFHKKKEQEDTYQDEIDIEKQKAKELDEAMQLEEKKTEKETPKEEKEVKRGLRKSKTLSSVVTLKDQENKSSKEKMKSSSVTKAKKENQEFDSTDKGIEVPKNMAEAKVNETEEFKNNENTLGTDENKGNDAALKPEVKTKETSKAEELKTMDDLKPKEEGKRTEEVANDNLKNIEKVSDGGKLPELTTVKQRSKSTRKPLSSKKLATLSNLVDNHEKKLQTTNEENQTFVPEANSSQPEDTKVEPINDSQKETNLPQNLIDDNQVSQNLNCENEVSLSLNNAESNDEDGNEITMDKDSHNEPRTTETMNADSGLSESSKSKKNEDVFEENSQMEGKLKDCIQVPGFMICVEAADGRLAGMEWGPQGLHVHCLQFTHVDYDIVIKDTVLNSMVPSKSPIAFLELSAEQTKIGRVYIKLWGHLRRAHNFLSLCLGDQGKSFLNTKFLQVYNEGTLGERMLGGDYETNNGRGGRGLLEDLEWNSDYAMPMKAGMVTAAGSGQVATNSLFLICTQSDPSRSFSCPFGLVCEGLKVVKDAIQHTGTKQIWITDCGVLIIPPFFDSSN